MTRRVSWLVILAWLMVGAAIWQMVTLSPYLNLDLTWDYLTLAALAFFSETTVDILPAGRLSTGFAVLLAAQLAYGVAPAVWIWTLATLMGQGTANRGNSLRTTIFNAAQYTLAAEAAGQTATLVGHHLPAGFLFYGTGQSLVFTAVYYLIGLLLLAVFHLQGSRPRTALRLGNVMGRDLLTYLVTVPFGLAMAILYKGIGLVGPLLLFAFLSYFRLVDGLGIR